jgi:hypothetical protein
MEPAMTQYLTEKETEEEMLQGYNDGFDKDSVNPGSNHSYSYRHGFRNAWRDRGLLPLAPSADYLRKRAKICQMLDMGVQLSINQARKQYITKLRKREWVCKTDHIEIHIDEGMGLPLLGPWIKLYSLSNPENDPINPQMLAIIQFDLDKPVYEPYLEFE